MRFWKSRKPGPSAIERLCAEDPNEGWPEYGNLVREIVALGAPAVPTLRHSLEWEMQQFSPRGLCGLAEALVRIEGTGATDAFQDAFRHFPHNGAVAAGLIRAGEAAVAVVIAILGDRNDNAHHRAILVLGAIGDDRAVLPLVAAYQQSEYPTACLQSLEVIAARGTKQLSGESLRALARLKDTRDRSILEPGDGVKVDARSIRKLALAELASRGLKVSR